jgi:hypothetical protein
MTWHFRLQPAADEVEPIAGEHLEHDHHDEQGGVQGSGKVAVCTK